MIVRHGDRYLGVLALLDTPRPAAQAMLARLKELGIERTIMLSGDNQAVADAVAAEVGLTEARGDLLPEDKVRFIRDLAANGEQVAMVGDGVNDAPALANATVGIAMGAGGSDVALETADVALMGDNLAALPFAVGLSRAARRVIVQNLVHQPRHGRRPHPLDAFRPQPRPRRRLPRRQHPRRRRQRPAVARVPRAVMARGWVW